MPRSKQSIKNISPANSESPNKRQTRSQTKELISAFENLDIDHADKLILHKGIDPSVVTPKLLTRTLYHAVKMQNTSLVRELLKYKQQLKTNDEEPLLTLAIKQSNVEIVTMLINAAVDSNETDYLHTGILCEDMKLHQVVVSLMEHVEDAEACDCYDKSVLFYAVKREALDAVEELLRKGVGIHRDESELIKTTMSTSAKAAELLILFFNYKCIDIGTVDVFALKAIFNFIERESDDATAVENLWDLGVSVDQTDCEGITALHYAVSKGKVNKVKLLLAHRADVNKKTHRGTTPIMLAVSLQESTIAALLIKRGANIHNCDIFGRYPIHIACKYGSTQNIQLLIHLGAKVDVMDQLDFTPFSLLHSSFTEQIDIFLKHSAFLTVNGISINDTDFATIQNDQDILKIYNECLEELKRMKETEFMNGVSYFDLISGKIEKLSILTKNGEFVNQFRKDQRNIRGKKFSWLKYSKELDIAFQMSEKRRDLLMTKEKMLQDSFTDDFPQVVLDKIARYLLFDDLNDFEKNFYLSLFSNENRK